MYIGIIILGVFIILTLLGLLKNLFKRWEIRESIAMAVMLLILGGVLLNPINISNAVIFSFGGFLIPFVVCMSLLFRAKSYEILRTLLAFIVIGVVSAFLTYYFPLDNNITIIDAGVFIGLIAGGIAFLIGRSRRGAFISAALGVMLSNIFYFLYNLITGFVTPVILGVGGQFSAIIIAALTATLIVEIAGETMEYKQNKETDVSFLGIDKFVNRSE